MEGVDHGCIYVMVIYRRCCKSQRQVTQPKPKWQQWSRFGGGDQTEDTWESTVHGTVEAEKAAVQNAAREAWATDTTSYQMRNT